MKSLLVVTRFMMEDTLRSLVLDNHSKCVAFVNAACSAKVLALRVPNSIPLHSDVVPDENSKERKGICSCVQHNGMTTEHGTRLLHTHIGC